MNRGYTSTHYVLVYSENHTIMDFFDVGMFDMSTERLSIVSIAYK